MIEWDQLKIIINDFSPASFQITEDAAGDQADRKGGLGMKDSSGCKVANMSPILCNK